MLPIHTLSLATGNKSFISNPILASPYLNRKGLHVKRIRLAERLAIRRQNTLKHLIGEAYAKEIDLNGYILIRDVLPEKSFQKLSSEVETTTFPAREMKQGDTVTRFITLPPKLLHDLPELQSFVGDGIFKSLLKYTSSFNYDPIINLHTVLTNPDLGEPDPQTLFHSDTFHAAAKGWFFLRDVEIEDGPFSYVPGSHRLTKGRLEWEQEQSLTAARATNLHHALGSFRATRSEIHEMGYGDAVPFSVPANSLVVADTHGFHARCVSSRPSTRLAIYGSLRSNPFNPVTWPALDPFSYPGLKGRKAEALDLLRTTISKISGTEEGQPLVGDVRPGDPAVR